MTISIAPTILFSLHGNQAKCKKTQQVEVATHLPPLGQNKFDVSPTHPSHLMHKNGNPISPFNSFGYTLIRRKMNIQIDRAKETVFLNLRDG